jgi:hypothetical protein
MSTRVQPQDQANGVARKSDLFAFLHSPGICQFQWRQKAFLHFEHSKIVLFISF